MKIMQGMAPNTQIKKHAHTRSRKRGEREREERRQNVFSRVILQYEN